MNKTENILKRNLRHPKRKKGRRKPLIGNAKKKVKFSYELAKFYLFF